MLNFVANTQYSMQEIEDKIKGLEIGQTIKVPDFKIKWGTWTLMRSLNVGTKKIGSERLFFVKSDNNRQIAKLIAKGAQTMRYNSNQECLAGYNCLTLLLRREQNEYNSLHEWRVRKDRLKVHIELK